MDKDLDTILGALDEYNETWESVADELRMSLIAIVGRHMLKKGWNQRTLARATGKAESFVSRALGGGDNSTIDTFARLLHAVGARGRIDTVESTRLKLSVITASTEVFRHVKGKIIKDQEEAIFVSARHQEEGEDDGTEAGGEYVTAASLGGCYDDRSSGGATARDSEVLLSFAP